MGLGQAEISHHIITGTSPKAPFGNGEQVQAHTTTTLGVNCDLLYP
jgi:hypothetical protein